MQSLFVERGHLDWLAKTPGSMFNKHKHTATLTTNTFYLLRNHLKPPTFLLCMLGEEDLE